MARALAGVLRDGRPIRGGSQLFVQSPDEVDEIRYRWLGVFILSHAGRLLYFPGVYGRGLRYYRGSILVAERDFAIDHISLEPDRTRWHATSDRSAEHQGGPTTADLGDDRRLWFGLFLRNVRDLHPVSQKTVAGSVVPSTDAKRRFDILASIYGVPSHCIQLPAKPIGGTQPVFPHFSAVVGPPGFQEYRGNRHCFPLESTAVEPEVRWDDIPVWTSEPIVLAGEVSIQVNAFHLPGELQIHPIFTSVDEP